ncbi:6f7d0fa7-9d8d-4118-9dca-1c8eb3568670 [Thermothielavioides terrestris]|uniref:ribonuclease T1 n=1 Tax=Thermothielavioides terrestris TaxID=2587410 RepID=A0A3S5CWM3_9PEZI|nr:6f7d0fa7-9d8d-4118-9dca-1c8eb3568670 [Thermothielavioides terrestris]
MVQLIPTLVALIGAVAVSAAPLTETRAASETCVYTCGSVCYWQSDIDAAVSKGVSLQQSGQEIDSYPHQYNDYEGFDFPTPSPWYEFPILSSYKVYSGGSPGPDRVIFDGNGRFDSVITHTGASGDDFVACKH